MKVRHAQTEPALDSLLSGHRGDVVAVSIAYLIPSSDQSPFKTPIIHLQIRAHHSRVDVDCGGGSTLSAQSSPDDQCYSI